MEEQFSNYLVCPCCGKNTASLTLCDAHDWYDFQANEKYSAILNKLRKHAGKEAYLGHGCMVCRDCEEAFYPRADYCPLAILQGGLRRFGVAKNKEQIVELIYKMLNYWHEQSLDKDTLKYRLDIFQTAVSELQKISTKRNP